MLKLRHLLKGDALKTLFVTLLLLSSIAQAKSKSGTCEVTTGDADFGDYKVLSTQPIAEGLDAIDLPFGNRAFRVSLLDGNRLVASSGSLMVQGRDYLFYADFASDYKLECNIK